MFKQIMTLRKETEGTVVYEGDLDGDCPIRVLYITKASMAGARPVKILVTVKEVHVNV